MAKETRKLPPIANLKEAFENNGISFCGCRYDLLHKQVLTETDLVINCTGEPMIRDYLVSSPTLFSNLFGPDKVRNKSEEIVLRIPDYSYLNTEFNSDFWESLVDIARENKFKRIIATCTGGKGRTGTTLAVLLIIELFNYKRNLLEKMDSGFEIVKAIKRMYYEDAVESNEQWLYIDSIFREIQGLPAEIIPETV